MNSKIFEEEKENLTKVIRIIEDKIEQTKKNFEQQEKTVIGVKEAQRGAHFTRQSLMSLYMKELNDLKTIVSNPYFGRFEFKKNNSDNIELIYIGKKNLLNDKNEIITYDWRSPICSMYYDYNIGDAEYNHNNIKEKGKLISKRQIQIKDGKLIRVDEQDTLSNDQILVQYLSETGDSRLKSIVSTIQKEQNKIIRNPYTTEYIVQGVAGSGKTTIALHRIAYVLYNDAKNVKESNFMILGPNKFFLNYISELLPDLDIGTIAQQTFEDIFMSTIKCKFRIESKNELLENIMYNEKNQNIIKYKSSIEFIKKVEEYVDKYIKSKISENIEYEGLILCKKERIEKICDNYSKNSYSERINILTKSIIKEIKENADDLSYELWQKYREEFLSLEENDPRRNEIINITNSLQKEIKSGCTKQIKEYFKFIKINPLDIYREFINDLDNNELKEITNNRINKKIIGYEDLAPLMAINYKLNGSKELNEYTNLVLDEAQDLSYAQYYILKKYFKNARFGLFGDINQSIYDYQSVDDWSKLNSIIFNNKATLLNLNKCYRTTLEVSNTANTILDFLEQPQAECIARKGEKVKIEINDIYNNISKLLEQINTSLDNGSKTIGIICKNTEEVKKLYSKFKKLNLSVNVIKNENEKYNIGISILPSFLSKGLEFDSVIISNANNEIYSDSIIDMKLLYVSITRAMHELYINYSGEISNPLKKILQEEKTKKLINK